MLPSQSLRVTSVPMQVPSPWGLGFPPPGGSAAGILFFSECLLYSPLAISFVSSTKASLVTKLLQLGLIYHVIILVYDFFFSNYLTSHVADIHLNSVLATDICNLILATPVICCSGYTFWSSQNAYKILVFWLIFQCVLYRGLLPHDGTCVRGMVGVASLPRINNDFCGLVSPQRKRERDLSLPWASSSQLLLLTRVQRTGEKIRWEGGVRDPWPLFFFPSIKKVKSREKISFRVLKKVLFHWQHPSKETTLLEMQPGELGYSDAGAVREPGKGLDLLRISWKFLNFQEDIRDYIVTWENFPQTYEQCCCLGATPKSCFIFKMLQRPSVDIIYVGRIGSTWKNPT